MLFESDYWDLVNEIKAIEDQRGWYLVDTGVHQQDAQPHHGTDEYWERMCDCAILFAANQCENEYDCSLNDLMGRIVY